MQNQSWKSVEENSQAKFNRFQGKQLVTQVTDAALDSYFEFEIYQILSKKFI
jgi:hypothetical protein